MQGAIMLHGLTAEEPDAAKIISEFKRNSMERYKELSEGFFTGWVMDAQQKFKIGNEVETLKADKDSREVSAYATCPINGRIKLLHAFDSVNFVPISNTPFEAVEYVPWYSLKAPQKISGTLDENGLGFIENCEPNRKYFIRFYPNVSEAEINALYASYDGVIAKLEAWLQSEWNSTISAQWKLMAPVGDFERLKQINDAYMQGVENALKSLWNDLKSLYDIISHPLDNATKLLEFISEIDLEKLKQAKDVVEKLLLIVSDEPLMFLYTSAFVTWLQLLPPTTIAELTSQILSTLLLDILLGIVLSGGAGLAVRYSVKAVKAVKGGSAVSLAKSIQGLIDISASHALKIHAQTAKPLIAKGEVAVNSSQKGTVAINSPAQQISRVEPDTIIVERSYKQNTKLSKGENVDDASAPAKSPNDKPVDNADKTKTDKCPVSMVTGEELLTLTDGELDGLLSFEWTRLYRTSAAEIDRGLGYGWSHSLSHRLEQDGEELVWTDHENRSVRFPTPDRERPAITNRLSRAAIYLGRDPSEVIVAAAGKVPRFYHFRRDAQGGYLIAISDAYDNRLSLTRDLMGRVQRLSNSAGRALRLRYEGKHIVAVDYQIMRPADTEEDSWETVQTLVRYRYNEAGQLLETANAAGEGERYRYDEHNVILERELAGGAAFYWEWEGQGKMVRCVRHWANFQQMEARYEWDAKGGVTVINADGSEQVYVHDDNARLVKQVDPDGATTEKAYDEKGQLIAERDPLGAITEYAYDEAGRLTAIVPAEEPATAFEYQDGYVSAVTRGKATWKYKRNKQGDITSQIDPDGNKTHYSYDKQGRLLSIRHADGSQHELVWNNLGQLLEEHLPTGAQRRYRYDALGRQITRQDETGAITQYQWDAIGRLTQITLPGGGTRAFTYNAYGKVTSERDELGRVTHYEYADKLHLMSRRINPDGSELRYRYDNARLLLTEIENERGERYSLDYYPNGLIRQETAFDGRSSSYVYDLNGHLIEKHEHGDDGSELVTQYQRDSAGRLLVKTLADGEQIHYSYDAMGRLSNVDDGQWPLSYRYDLQDRLIEEHQGWATLRYEYGALGQLSHCRLPDGSKLDYRHQPGGALAAIDLNGQSLTVHQFSASGREQYRQQGALLSEYQYDEQGRLKAHSLRQDQQAILNRHYRYDAKGNLAGINDSRKGSKSYHYDPLDRLVAVRGETPESFVHDPAGTLLAQNSGVSSERVNVKGNRLLMQGDRHYDYDAYGNLIRERRGAGHKLVTEYRYDNQHRLIGVSLPDGSQASYRYDAFGRRIAKDVNGKTTEFLWQGDRLIAESGQDHYCSYVYEPGSFRPLAMLQGEGKNAEPYYYQLDHLGTPQELTSASGQILWSVQYRAYGNVAKLEVAEVDNPLRFQGQYFDAETGLHYNRHRYYNPNTGSYLTPDPIKLAGGLNNYQYVPNPTGWVDPLGLACVSASCPDAEFSLSQNKIDEIKSIPKGERPEPSTYLPKTYIDTHLEKFESGATRFMTSDSYNKYGIGQRDGTSFVMPSSEVDELIAKTKGNAFELEKALGLPSGYFKENSILKIDIVNPKQLNLRVPSGNEAGANEYWIPGGKLPNGNSEAIIDVNGKEKPILNFTKF
ncbi:type IV secretion protein Rhs [Pseudomonas sp. TTU2014-080ASC]|nr:type IV secretion protein Rhs [Pseudomonas sp. TTU2014-080ASC]